MKKIDTFENFNSSFPKSKKEIHSVCKKFRIQNYTINDDGSVDGMLNYSKEIYLNFL